MFRLFTLAIVVALSGFSAAQAEIFVWQSAAQDISFTVPDTWRMGHNQAADDIATFAAPDREAFPECRVKKRIDGRFNIYPSYLQDEVHRVFFGRDFWERYVGEFEGADVEMVRFGGLDNNSATYSVSAYEPVNDIKMNRKAIAFAALKGERLFIVECSAEASLYEKWEPAFLSVIKSVRLAPYYHTNRGGNYREAQADLPLIIRGKRKLDAYKY